MECDCYFVVGVKTAQHEWFALSTLDAGLIEAGFEPNVGRSEAELRAQLRYLGLSETDIDERFQNARKWMASVTPSPVSDN